MKEYVQKLKSLSDETRLRIFHLLIHSRQQLCVCEIVDSLKIPSYAVSRHMRELRNAGFVHESRQGKFVMYACADDESDFFSAVSALMNTMHNEQLDRDISNLQDRLSLRVNGVCTIGAQK